MGILLLLAAGFAAALHLRPVLLAQTIRVVGFTNHPVPPVRIADNLYYVGARDIGAFLLVGNAGHILFDAGYVETVPQITANIRALGFDPADIALIVNTHAHDDHAGGIAAMQRLTGARLIAGARDVRQLAVGGRGDYHFADTMTYAPVRVHRAVQNGDDVRLGNLAVRAIATPGHTPGCTSWSFAVSVAGVPQDVLLICSVSRLRAPLMDNPAYRSIGRDFARSFARLRVAPCDIWLTPHALQFGLRARRAQIDADNAAAFVDPVGCRRFLSGNEAAFRTELAAARD